MTNLICSYCRSTWRRAEFHDNCCECGAPMLQAIEFIQELRAFRDSDPSNPYWMDGGVSLRADEEIFAVWA